MDNPYSSNLSESTSVPSTAELTPGVMQALGGTKPWVRFCSVVGFILSGFMVILALVMLVAGGAMFNVGSAGGSSVGTVAAAMPIVMSLIYLVVAAIYIMPSIKLWKYGSHILKLMNSQSMDDLERALDTQRSFWKFVGIMILGFLVLYALLIVVVIIGGMASGISSSSPVPIAP